MKKNIKLTVNTGQVMLSREVLSIITDPLIQLTNRW